MFAGQFQLLKKLALFCVVNTLIKNMNISISNQMWREEVRHLVKTTSLSKTKTKEIMAELLAGMSVSEYQQQGVANYTGFYNQFDFTDIEVLSFPELYETNERLLIALNSHLSSNEAVTEIHFINTIVKQKVARYINGDNRFILHTYLLVAPYLYGYWKSAPKSTTPYQLSDWHVEAYAASLRERYYIPFKIESIGEPYFGDEDRCRKNYVSKILSSAHCSVIAILNKQLEIIGNKTNFNRVNCAEENVLDAIGQDICAGGDGEMLAESIRSILELEKPQLQSSERKLYEIDFPALSPKISDLYPTKKRKVGVSGNIPVNNFQMHTQTYSSLTARIPIDLNVFSDDSHQASRGDLIAGIHVYGGYKLGAHTVAELIIGQLISQGGGVLVMHDVCGLIYETARVFGRESDYHHLSYSQCEMLTQNQVNWIIRSNKIAVISDQVHDNPQLFTKVCKLFSNYKRLSTLVDMRPPFTYCWKPESFSTSVTNIRDRRISPWALDALALLERSALINGFGRLVIDAKRFFEADGTYLSHPLESPLRCQLSIVMGSYHTPVVPDFVKNHGQFKAGDFVLATQGELVSKRVHVFGYTCPQKGLGVTHNILPFN